MLSAHLGTASDRRGKRRDAHLDRKSNSHRTRCHRGAGRYRGSPIADMRGPRKTSSRPRDGGPAAIAPAPPPPPAPDPLGPLRGVVRRWPVVAAVTALALAAAVAAGLAQAPTYTASADINVGRVDVRVQTLPGYVAGAQVLAAAYSRVAASDELITPLARKLGLPA